MFSRLAGIKMFKTNCPQVVVQAMAYDTPYISPSNNLLLLSYSLRAFIIIQYLREASLGIDKQCDFIRYREYFKLFLFYLQKALIKTEKKLISEKKCLASRMQTI